MFYVATAVGEGGEPGHLHKGDDWDHVITDLAELERATGNGHDAGAALEGAYAGSERR